MLRRNVHFPRPEASTKKDELKEIQTNLLHQQEQQQEMKCYTGVLLFVIGLLQVSKF